MHASLCNQAPCGSGMPAPRAAAHGPSMGAKMCAAAGDSKDAGGDIVEIPDGTDEVWLLAGRKTAFYSRPDPGALPRGDLHAAAAHWCARRLAPRWQESLVSSNSGARPK